jgi:YggT family protein
VWLMPIFNLIDTVLGLYVLVIIIRVLINLLQVFGVLDYRNPVVRGVEDVCAALTEPLLRPIRRFLPAVRGVDLGPLVLLLLVELGRQYLRIFAVQTFVS